MEAKRLNVLIADDHSIVRDGLKFLLSTRDDLLVVGEAANSDEILHVLSEQRVDLLLLDLGMPGVNRLQFIRDLRGDYPKLKILVLTANIELSTIRGVLDAGVHAYITKADESHELFDAIDAVRLNNRYLALSVRFAVDGHDHTPSDIGEHLIAQAELTPRERQILSLVAQGATARDIAERFCISPFTVRKHRENLMRKLDLHNTAELAVYAVRLGLPTG
ncbi:two component transcriptional regulator, LuxR family [Pseudomonas sp. ok272]|uniref:response regulator n=1 Tax=unclassified Pseudomonas TaxID=196821 RepID=UPI0008BE309D|nr:MULTISPECIES: response regulator transcription factor [unclassified Pseudomonas]SEN45151.1 two component transcriptional regulator, LuxR family [Pseudomonas sp. ok272]SFM81150.1 two component transcriptional regulator, LuxR family [Pseudomonas sp. ok602]